MASSEVIDTISSAVASLEGRHQQPERKRSYEHATDSEFRDAITSVSVSNVEGGESIRHLDGHPQAPPFASLSQLLATKYLPFRPPPVPSAEDSERDSSSQPIEGEEGEEAEAELPSRTLQKAYSTVLTILESTHPNGSKTYTAQASPILSETVNNDDDGSSSDGPHVQSSQRQDPSTFLERRRARHERWLHSRQERTRNASLPSSSSLSPSVDEADERKQEEEDEEEEGKVMWSISVRRQRKLKMKKHKYKKLMRRTRNLRRRQDRA